jgi:hypothetical protein
VAEIKFLLIQPLFTAIFHSTLSVPSLVGVLEGVHFEVGENKGALDILKLVRMGILKLVRIMLGH